MKVLSLLQPWASLVVAGHKLMETRSWNTKYRGELLIHASAGKAYKKIPAEDPLYKYYHLLFAHNKIEPIEQLPFGAIIGKVNLTDTIPTDSLRRGMERKIISWHEQELAFGNYTDGRFAWLLSEPVKFLKPIPATGSLGIWELKSNTVFNHMAKIILTDSKQP